jgi:hypothetical protein
MQFGARLDPKDPTMLLLMRGDPPETVVRLSPKHTADLIEVLKSLHERQLCHADGARIMLPPLALVR